MEAICRSNDSSAESEEYDTEEFGEVEVGKEEILLKFTFHFNVDKNFGLVISPCLSQIKDTSFDNLS
jgi:hypothetical protein